MTWSRFRLRATRVVRSLWFTPALYAAVAVLVLATAPFAAHLLPAGLMTLIGLSGVYDLLNALASTLLAVAIFSLGIMASSLQAAASAATPRARPLLTEDSTARRAISTFIGGFVYAVVGIVGLSTGYYSDASKVLLFFVTCLVILPLIVALIRWIGRLTRLGDVTESIDLVERAARAALRDAACDPHLGGRPARGAPCGWHPVPSPRVGFVQAIDLPDLAAAAEAMGADLHVVARPGRFVGPGRPLLLADRPLSAEEGRRLAAYVVVGGQRTFEADPRFGLTVLGEIGSRALSPGINDPGTAIDVIASEVRLLCDWGAAAAEARPEVCHPRLHVEALAPEDLVGDAFRWIARDGAGLVEVQVWVQSALEMLVRQDEGRFGAAARALSREARARAEAAIDHPEDRERLRAAAGWATERRGPDL